jgi:hypothetical protein
MTGLENWYTLILFTISTIKESFHVLVKRAVQKHWQVKRRSYAVKICDKVTM